MTMTQGQGNPPPPYEQQAPRGPWLLVGILLGVGAAVGLGLFLTRSFAPAPLSAPAAPTPSPAAIAEPPPAPEPVAPAAPKDLLHNPELRPLPEHLQSAKARFERLQQQRLDAGTR